MNSQILTANIKRDLWYKEPWLLLVVGGPLLVVMASILTGFIAFRGADQVVAKDYYRQGLMINTNLQRDANARALKLGAHLQLDVAKKQIVMQLQSVGALPEMVQLSIASSGANAGSVSEIVHRLPMQASSVGRYVGDLPHNSGLDLALVQSNVKLLHLKLETNEWRLTGDWHDPLQRSVKLTPVQ